jgi:hypothetical protein
MMVAGSIDGGSNWVEATSLARAIEDAMVAAGVIDVDKETKDTTRDRRKSFVAIATGLIAYLKANMEITITAGKFGAPGNSIPAAATTLTQAVK